MINSELKKYLRPIKKNKKNNQNNFSEEKKITKKQIKKNFWIKEQDLKNIFNKKIHEGFKTNLPEWAITSNRKTDSEDENINKSIEVLNWQIDEVYPTPDPDIKDLLRNLKIKPNNIQLYIDALTHSSYSNENNLKNNYQRLEFLGDAILNKLVAIFLYTMSDDDEGKMTKDRISIIQAKTLIRASYDLNLGKYVRVGHGLLKRPLSEKILEDIFESFVGALYLDHDERKVNSFLFKTLFKYYLNDDLQNTIDYKTKFQEAVQEHGKRKNIVYKKIENKNNSSNFFEVELIYNGMIYGRGRGIRLHDAEVAAAKKACEKISKNSTNKVIKE
ncbi:ribonuclease III [Mycoplasmoides pirum]|uniref:ribonuclease III n=1 Tax=Mycoplasmoides pirum TaxID=2122 RepID=UPI000697505B|nr:ribonuclease III [Mycoplasmoides pirum]